MSKLPKLHHPIFEVLIPSSKKKTKIRPMLVREEKILLMAKESQNPYDIFQSIAQVVGNCLVNDDLDVDKLTLFDLEYLFLQIRAVSVSNVVDITYTDSEDLIDYDFKVDLNDVKVKMPEKENFIIQTGDNMGFTMKYPLATLYSTETFTKGSATEQEMIDELIIACVDSYFDGDNIYKFKDQTKEEILSFIGDMDITTYNKVREFVANLPSLEYIIKYKNKKGTDREIRLTTLSDFFTLR